MMIAEGFTCQRYGFNVGADKFSLLTIENGKTSIMRLSEWTLISQSQKSHSDRLLEEKTIIVSTKHAFEAVRDFEHYAGDDLSRQLGVRAGRAQPPDLRL